MHTVELARTPADFEAALALRYEVFCGEQGVPREIELDAGDALATHVVVREAGSVVATGRVLRQRSDGADARLADPALPGDFARIGRMAVAKERRGSGLGEAMLGRLEALAAEAGIREALLHAQVHAQGFYARSGYAPRGDVFEEAGIAHVEMTKVIRPGAER